MGYRALPTAAETLRVMRHLADVTSLKGDPSAQRQLLVDGLGELFGTTLGWFFVIDDMRHGRALRPAVGTLASNLDPAWVRYMADFAVNVAPSDDMYADHLMRSEDVEQQWTRARVLPDADAHRRYGVTIDVADRAGIGDGAVCAFRTGPSDDRMVGFSLHRCRTDPKMRDRDYGLHRFALTEIRRLVARGHLTLSGADGPLVDLSPPPLSPRQRQVLDFLLVGDAPKSIARQLGLSVWTVRDHVQHIYREFGVSGRDELMARHIGRAVDR
jgi:DNA-binding CsgD family transcriptional regulator